MLLGRRVFGRFKIGVPDRGASASDTHELSPGSHLANLQ